MRKQVIVVGIVILLFGGVLAVFGAVPYEVHYKTSTYTEYDYTLKYIGMVMIFVGIGASIVGGVMKTPEKEREEKLLSHQP